MDEALVTQKFSSEPREKAEQTSRPPTNSSNGETVTCHSWGRGLSSLADEWSLNLFETLSFNRREKKSRKALDNKFSDIFVHIHTDSICIQTSQIDYSYTQCN